MTTALQFLISLKPHLPMTMNGNKPEEPSNSEIRRWLQQNAVIINGKKPQPGDDIEFPIYSLIFFPKSQKSRCTMQLDYGVCTYCGNEALGLHICNKCGKNVWPPRGVKFDGTSE